MAFLSDLSGLLWGGPLLAAFLLVGGYYSLRTGFFQLFRFPVWWRASAGSLLRRRKEEKGAGVSQLQALSTALAATIGTGSIAGVAAAIFYGGPGTVFWMWVSALLGMMTGCAEKILAVRHREKGPDGQWRGGPMEYIRRGLNLPGLAKLYALLCVAETLVGGNLAQSNSIATALSAQAGTNRLTVGVVLAVVVSVVLLGGIRRVGRLSELLVPLMALLFLGGGLVVIFTHVQAVPDALADIVRYAFQPRAAVGGYGMGLALRYGVARGVFTNEAGLGMSAIAHACADVEEPAEQGMWGIFEVFFATLVICTVTALVILTSGVYTPEGALDLIAQGSVPDSALGAPLTAASFATVLGGAGEWIVSVSLILFAFTSLLGAGYYGRRGLEALTGSRLAAGAYQLIFPGCVMLGAVADLSAVWELVDLLNGLLAIPNLLALLLLSPEALHLLGRWLRERRPVREAPLEGELARAGDGSRRRGFQLRPGRREQGCRRRERGKK
ncbi:MAG TPA: sodium:alanine symporter family protein [Candidatus Enterenecus merdae]|nr:sodium:alanine symporter family protein [Candidatus Enterenecus merdae]